MAAMSRSRERVKDMALDHAGADPAQDFAAPRRIDFGHHAPEPPDVRPQPDDPAETREAALCPARTRAITFHLTEVAVTGPMMRAIFVAICRLRAPPLET